MENVKNIESFVFDETAQTITIEVRRRGLIAFLTHPPKMEPDSIERMVYGVVDGKLRLIESKLGRIVPEHIVFE